MKTILTSTILACSLLLGGKQDLGPSQTLGTPGSVAPPASPSFVQYTYVSFTGSSGYASITTPAMTTGPNELLVAYCMSATTPSDSSDLPTVPPEENATGASFTVIGTGATSDWNDGQVGYLYLGSTAPVVPSTFTCTMYTKDPYDAMVVLEFAVPPVTLNTSSTTSNSNTVTTFTSGAITATSAPTLNVLCAGGRGGDVFTAGTIGGAAATVVGVDQPSVTDAGAIGCEWNTSSAVLSSATGTITSSSGTNWVGSLAAFSY